MGASTIVKEYLGINYGHALPFSLAHGVQPMGSEFAQDLLQPEPIHWSYNTFIYQAAKHVKESVLLPHPWILLDKLKQKQSSNAGALLIGPPPSKANDEALYKLICTHKLPASILIKPRGPYVQKSMNYWKDKGVKPVACGNYSDLYDVLLSHQTVIASYPTSAIFFASSIGCSIELIKDFNYLYYERIPENSDTGFASILSSWCHSLNACFNREHLYLESLELLGGNLCLSANQIRNSISSILGKCKKPFFTTRRLNSDQFRLHCALAHLGLSRPSFASLGMRNSIKSRALKNFSSPFPMGLFRAPSINQILLGEGRSVLIRNVPPSESSVPGVGGNL